MKIINLDNSKNRPSNSSVTFLLRQERKLKTSYYLSWRVAIVFLFLFDIVNIIARHKKYAKLITFILLRYLIIFFFICANGVYHQGEKFRQFLFQQI